MVKTIDGYKIPHDFLLRYSRVLSKYLAPVRASGSFALCRQVLCDMVEPGPVF
jgi:hypothetical protein